MWTAWRNPITMEGNQTLNLSGLLYSESSEEDKHHIFFNFVVNGILLNVIGIFGLFGNAVSMVILSHQSKSSYNYLLICLAGCDTLLIVMTMLVYGTPAVFKYTEFFFVYFYFKIYPYIVCTVFPLSLATQMVEIYLTLMVTLERFLAVCRPLHTRTLCTYQRTRYMFFLVVLFACLFNLPRFWDFELKEVEKPSCNMTLYTPEVSALRVDPVYINVYINWLNFILLFLFPFSILTILNVAIYKQVRRANKVRRQLTEGQKKDIELATILLAIVIVFLFCNILPLVNNITEIWYMYTIPETVSLSCMLVTLNSSVNFIIYVLLGQRFRREFCEMLCCRTICIKTAHRREQDDGNTYLSSLTSSPGNRSMLSTFFNSPHNSPRQRSPFQSASPNHLSVQGPGMNLQMFFT